MILSKTNFITFLDCEKNAWLKIHRPDIYKQYPLSSFEQNIIDTGNEVDVLARALFPNGVLVSRDDVLSTQQLIHAKTPVIYQPVFTTDMFTTACDILVYNNQTCCYDIYEVKSSTGSEDSKGKKIEDYYIDIAFQDVVAKIAGVVVGDLYLIRLNKEYVRIGDVNVQNLFLIENVTKAVRAIVDDVEQKMIVAYQRLSSTTEPMGHCDCVFKGWNAHCTTAPYSMPDLPEYPVHAIARIHSKKLTELVDSGITSIHDIPEDFPLSENQRRQVITAQTNRPHIDAQGIRRFLKTMNYPLAFLDYETYPCAIPRYNKYRPYQHIPFQFSLHIVHAPDAQLLHYDFLHDTSAPPDVYLAEALEEHLPKQGSVVVWNQKFEKGINQQIGLRQTEYQLFLEDVNNRIVDLMIPFSGTTMVYDHPQCMGSASIKYVLPALVPHLSYKHMHIQEGGTAADTWNRIITKEYSEEESLIKKQALKDYCCLDTLAMVEIWRVLTDI